MEYLSVCSGIEAASVAWEPLGWKPVLLSEIESFPRAVLRHRLRARDIRYGVKAGHVPLWGDFTALRPRHFRRFGINAAFDVLVGGTPCQSFSVAGLRQGLDDPRGNLMLAYAGLAKRHRPDWLVWENVPGVLSSNGGRDFAALLGLLSGQVIEPPEEGWKNSGFVAGIDSAYGLAWRVLDAQYVRVDGYARAVPQRRRRVFVVGCLGDWRRAAAVLFERESLSEHPPPRREAGQRPAPSLAARTRGGGGLGTDAELDGALIPAPPLTGNPYGDHASREAMLIPEFAQAVTSKWAKGTGGPAGDEAQNLLAVAHTLTGEGHDAGADGTGKGTPIVPVQCAGTNVSTNDVPSLKAGNGGLTGGVPAIAFGWQNAAAQGDDVREELSPTLDKSKTPAVAFSSKDHGADASMAVRRLTPRECERLQGFPDDFTRIPIRRLRRAPKPERLERFPDLFEEQEDGTWIVYAQDGPRYRALGNSMAVNVMRWIGQRIELVASIDAQREVA